MSRTLYLDCSTGISGDMTVAALLDAGADRDYLQQVLQSVKATGFSIEYSRVKKAGLDCMDFSVRLDAEYENHDHDIDYLHGHEHHHEHANHHHEHEHHHHEHRGMKEITEIIESTIMTDNAKSIAKRIFSVLAEAESKAHGVALDQVHFHEVGAIDSIVDIIAVSVCIDNLQITDTIVTHLCEGTGTVRCQHGILSIPVPAVSNIVEKYEIPMKIINVQGELVTPTGAAIVAALQTKDALPETFVIKKTGLGAGKREYERPGILRAMILEEKHLAGDEIWKLETNIDDCTGENLGFVMERLLKKGAKDVFYTPIYMKKNRPAWLLTVICGQEKREELETIIFNETTTIGIRRQKMQRTVLEREAMQIDTIYGTVQAKKCIAPSGERIYPEYESVASLCKEKGISYMELIEAIKIGMIDRPLAVKKN